MDKCEVQSDCFVIRASKIKCAYPRGREIAFSILNTTLHSPQKHFPGLKTAIQCPGATEDGHSGELEPRHQAIHKTIPPTAAGRARLCDRQGPSSKAGRARRCRRQKLLPQQGKQGAAAGKGSSRSRESKALRPAKARPTAWRARLCDRQGLVEEQEEQVAAAGKGSSRSRVSEALRPQRLILQHEEQSSATSKSSSRSRESEALRPQRLILQHEEQSAAAGKG